MAVAIKEGRQVRGVQAVLERPDGTRIPFMPYPTPLRDAAGTLVAASNVLLPISPVGTADPSGTVIEPWPELTPDPLISGLGLEDLTGCLQNTLAAQADVEFGYRIDCERLEDWSGPTAEKERILDQLEEKRERQRAVLNTRLEQLQQRATEIMVHSRGQAEQRARTLWPHSGALH